MVRGHGGADRRRQHAQLRGQDAASSFGERTPAQIGESFHNLISNSSLGTIASDHTFPCDALQFEQRRKITSTKFVPRSARPNVSSGPDISASAADLEAEALYRAEANKQLDEDEEIFNIEEGLGNRQTFTWEDKYRPRKPRYFNRVHTGFEWNKYNQTHYDSDNPPPKVVQGYKFKYVFHLLLSFTWCNLADHSSRTSISIFYPDLLDNQVAPTYRIVKDREEPEIATIIFSAGPPYEDIAFKIVNKEWEHSHKRGFRSSFDRGVLQLYFNFRRSFYRK